MAKTKESPIKRAWGRIVERAELALLPYEANPEAHEYPNPVDLGSIFDEIELQYTQDHITEEIRELMAEQVKQMFGDLNNPEPVPYAPHPRDMPWEEVYVWEKQNERIAQGYDTYACGLWAPTEPPLGGTECALILMACVIMEAVADELA